MNFIKSLFNVAVDIDAATKIYGKEITNKDGIKFMKIDKMFVDFRFNKSRFRIKDVINHGNVIGKINFKITV